MSKKYSYWDKKSEVDFSEMYKNGWKYLSIESPTPSSFEEVLVLKEKHGNDVDCIIANWLPTNNYTDGIFTYPNGKEIVSKIYMWKPLKEIIIK